MIKRRINIRMSGLGGQGVVTSAHVMAMAPRKTGSKRSPIPSSEREADGFQPRRMCGSASSGSMTGESWCIPR